MVHIFNFCFLLLLGYLCFFHQPENLYARDQQPPTYELAISFDTDQGRITGTAKIDIPPEQELSLYVKHQQITGAFIRSQDGVEKNLKPVDGTFSFLPDSQARTVFISYYQDFRSDYANLISKDGISLTGGWYPYPSNRYHFKLSAQLPDGFSAITESDVFPLMEKDGTVHSSWSQPTSNITFVAGPYEIDKREVRDGLYVYSMFFPEDNHLSAGYLEAAARYIRQHEKEIGPFPYNHFVIVANRLPTGYGMSSFTLIGQMVLRLPFIQTSSLGHEIVHSWFGNEVEVDYSQGNWAEGLTSFLADHSYRAAEGKGIEDRKASLRKYHSYVTADLQEPFSLKDFQSASHNQPLADAKRAIGYNGGAFFFHELRTHLGAETFSQGIQNFYRDNRGRTASWKDIQKSFEKVSGKDLASFFDSRLTMTSAPQIAASDIAVESVDTIQLNFTLKQSGEEVVPLDIPIHVTTMSGETVYLEHLDSSEQKVSLTLTEIPLSFILDPEYTMLRQLTPAERAPVWSQFLGAENKLIILASETEREKYQPIIESLKKYQPTVVLANAVSNKMLAENNLLFLGADQAPCRSIFGSVVHSRDSLTVDVRKNPLRTEYVAAIISDNRQKGAPSVARRLNHYGKYTTLIFKDDGSVDKTISKSENGIRYQLERIPAGGSTANLQEFDDIMDELAQKRVIYLGETHNSLSDHILQLRVIEALYQRKAKLAIGMEMFPSSSQGSLDEFTLEGSTMTEQAFLKESNYFKVWGYDYRLFRDILNFAKAKHLPLRGLNLDRKIVNSVFRAGNTDGLSSEVTKDLVQERNLDLPGYQERLAAIHSMHVSGKHGKGASSGFIQSQALWDETMAENIAIFLRDNPDYTMVVIAGSQHTRKDSGIPPRVSARIEVDQASLINITNGQQPANLDEVADYYFFSDYLELPPSAKIGLVLHEKDDVDGLTIDTISPHGKAGAAGLKAGDILLRINSNTIENMADLKIAMIDARVGDEVELEILRGEKRKRHSFKVELSAPTMGKSHP